MSQALCVSTYNNQILIGYITTVVCKAVRSYLLILRNASPELICNYAADRKMLPYHKALSCSFNAGHNHMYAVATQMDYRSVHSTSESNFLISSSFPWWSILCHIMALWIVIFSFMCLFNKL